MTDPVQIEPAVLTGVLAAAAAVGGGLYRGVQWLFSSGKILPASIVKAQADEKRLLRLEATTKRIDRLEDNVLHIERHLDSLDNALHATNRRIEVFEQQARELAEQVKEIGKDVNKKLDDVTKLLLARNHRGL
jgi:septal ring factor EnvC (AmiA/AmiB activator)